LPCGRNSAKDIQGLPRLDFSLCTQCRGLFLSCGVSAPIPARTENHRDPLVLVEDHARQVAGHLGFIVRVGNHKEDIGLETLIRGNGLDCVAQSRRHRESNDREGEKRYKPDRFGEPFIQLESGAFHDLMAAILPVKCV
jgi:hypothetical protein